MLSRDAILSVMGVNPRKRGKDEAQTPSSGSARTVRATKRTGGSIQPMNAESRARAADAIAQRVHSDVEAIATKAAELAIDLVQENAQDPYGVAGEIFAEELRSLLGDALPDPGVARRAARLAVAEQAWAARLGRLLDTRDVVDLLKVSKQRVSTLARDHRLIALSQGGRLRFPAWQFAVREAGDREGLAAAHRQLVESGGLSPWSAASWFQGGHAELDGKDPVEFLRTGGNRERLLTVARRDADRLAQ
jgi:hypothetical protein